ncbi:MAG: hypothetical protein ISS35_04580 [Kiritimatiellae bacterium]|nr:hypothetical protein [Kiritimatiellia bacterium]
MSEHATQITLILSALDDYCNCEQCTALRQAYTKARHICSAITLAEAHATAHEIVAILNPFT